MNKPWKAIAVLATLISTNLHASTEQDFSKEPLVQRCLNMLNIYANEDFDAYIAEFPKPWLSIFGEKTLKEILAERHDNYTKEYQAKPDTIKVKAIAPTSVAKIELERLGATEAKKINLYIASDKGNSTSTACKFLRIGDNWYFRSLRL
jgi:hypothetical protein